MSSFEELLKSLREEYLASMPEKIDLLKKQIDAGAIPPLQDSFHKLKGTGRTYGMPEVSELAEALERLCIEQPQRALAAAPQATALLQDIFVSRQNTAVFDLNQDQRFQSIQKLLQK